MKMQGVRSCLVMLILLSPASPVLAHTGISSTHSFVDGFIHPLRGADHLLVMLATGFWAYSLAGNRIWQLPLIFLLMMLLGAGLQMAGFPILLAEQAVILSVLVFGVIIGFNWRTSTHLVSGLVAVFAFFHGVVHAAESSEGHFQMAYLFGFLFTTTGLLSAGMAVGILNAKIHQVVRIGFGFISTLIGLALCMG